MDTIGEQETILLFSQDAELSTYLTSLLKGEGYEIEACTREEQIFTGLKVKKVGLFICDFEKMSSLDICKKIRNKFSTRHIPIIVLINRELTMEKIKCIYAGADDYVSMPAQSGDILIRVKANLWRANRVLNANPLTKLPGNVTILNEIEQRIKSGEIFCTAYSDLDNFKEYNDHYGFEKGDRIIKQTAKIIADTLEELQISRGFLGHIGGDDFIFITGGKKIHQTVTRIIEKFDKIVPTFYSAEDLEKGYIIVKNREGKVTAVPLLTISIGIATNQNRSFNHVGEIIQIITELKSCAKKNPKSSYVIDKRLT